MYLDVWAEKWGVSRQAIRELRLYFGVVNTDPPPGSKDSEGDVQARLRLEASRRGIKLFRNNVGAAYMIDGGFVRYGLANDSKKLNNKLKSSDLIGIKPVLINNRHVGHTLGQFIAREVKESAWKYRGTEREVAQLAFIEMVVAMGGDACFANSEGMI